MRGSYFVSKTLCKKCAASLAGAIKKRITEYTIDYQIYPLRQAIAGSWLNSLADSSAKGDSDVRRDTT